MRYYDGYPSATFGTDGETVVPAAVRSGESEAQHTQEENPNENMQSCKTPSVKAEDSDVPSVQSYLPAFSAKGFLSSLFVSLSALLILRATPQPFCYTPCFDNLYKAIKIAKIFPLHKVAKCK